MLDDLKLRGLKPDRRRTFDARLRACFYLVLRAEAPDFRVQEWSAKRPYDLPARVWSDEQATVISKVQEGVASQDANVRPGSRFLLVTGGPGTGKTEVSSTQP